MDTRHIYLSREMVKQGHEVHLVLSDSNHNLKTLPVNYNDVVDGVKVSWIKTFKYSKVYGIRRILSWMSFERRLRGFLRQNKNEPADVVIVSSLSLLSILNGIRYKKRYNCKLVFEVRDIWPLILKRIKKLSRLNIAYRYLARIERKGYDQADLVIGTMPNLTEHVESVLGRSKSVTWIPHLVNPNMNYKENHRYHESLDKFKEEGWKIVGYAGSVNMSSCLDVFIEAANQLQPQKIKFVILGEGPLLTESKKLASSEHIHFFNKINQNEVVAFLKDCDILFDGYLKSELYKYGNSRNKYVEYCLAAKPILLAYAGFPLFVETHNCGVVVEPESANTIIEGIQLLVNKDSNELNTMGNNALKFAHEHLQVEEQTKKLIREIAV